MVIKVYYLAQSLDNSGADHVYVDEMEITAERVEDYQSIAAFTSKVALSGLTVYSEGGLMLKEYKGKFFIEIETCERDNQGRIAPILVYLESNQIIDEALIERICIGIENFLKKIHRSILPEDFLRIRSALNRLNKKYSATKIDRSPLVIGIAIIFVIAIFVILKNKITN